MIEVRGLSKSYGSTPAVDDLSFTVGPGRVTGFLGPNGAGKSTTMRMILGLDRPMAGEALIHGRRYAQLAQPLRTVGALLDATWVHPNRTAAAHLRWMAQASGIDRGRVDEVLGMVGLADVAGKRAGGFSLGMSQRLGIACALIGDPAVLLFDEPVNGLDPEGIVWIRTFMQSLAAQGHTVLVSSHLLAEMALTAADLVVIGRGRLIAQCGVAEFTAGAAESSVRVRTPDHDRLRRLLVARGRTVYLDDGALRVPDCSTEEIGELAAEHRIVLHELGARHGTLEQAFVQLTGDDVEYRTTAAQTPEVRR